MRSRARAKWVGDIIGNMMKRTYGNGLIGHGTEGYPKFDGWPHCDNQPRT